MAGEFMLFFFALLLYSASSSPSLHHHFMYRPGSGRAVLCYLQNHPIPASLPPPHLPGSAVCSIHKKINFSFLVYTRTYTHYTHSLPRVCVRHGCHRHHRRHRLWQPQLLLLGSQQLESTTLLTCAYTHTQHDDDDDDDNMVVAYLHKR